MHTYQYHVQDSATWVTDRYGMQELDDNPAHHVVLAIVGWMRERGATQEERDAVIGDIIGAVQSRSMREWREGWDKGCAYGKGVRTAYSEIVGGA